MYMLYKYVSYTLISIFSFHVDIQQQIITSSTIILQIILSIGRHPNRFFSE